MTIRKVLILFAAISVLINAYLAALYGGFAVGYSYADSAFKSCHEMGFSGGTAYDSYASVYLFMFGLSLLFMLVRFLRDWTVFEIICACILILELVRLIYFHSIIENLDKSELRQFYSLLLETSPLRWISTLLLLLMIALQSWLTFSKSKSVFR